MVWTKGADGLVRSHLHLLKGSIRVAVGQPTKSGQPIAQICTEWTCTPPGPHLHFGVFPANDRLSDVTVPSAFDNYEVRQPIGTWKFVSRGIPQQGQVVRRTGELSSWDEIVPASAVLSWTGRVTAMTALNRKLFATTDDNKLWWRDPLESSANWEHIGHANHVVAMTAINCKLFAVTSDNKLWWREPVGSDVDWEHIGQADYVVAMAAANGKLFAATQNNKLWWREPLRSVGWGHIGYLNDVVAMAATHGKLFAATKDDKLWWREPVGINLNWDHIGHAIDVVGMAGINGKLFAATGANKLWVRNA